MIYLILNYSNIQEGFIPFLYKYIFLVIYYNSIIKDKYNIFLNEIDIMNNNLEKEINEVINEYHKRWEMVFEKFFKEIGMFIDNKAFSYSVSICNKKLLIYTNNPGVWIGKYGKTLLILKSIIKDEFGEMFTVDFKEAGERTIINPELLNEGDNNNEM